MNNTLGIVGTVLGTVALVLTLTGNKELHISNNNDQLQTISVSGEAETFVAPDTASISFSMTRKNASLSIATDSVNTRVGEMLDSFSEFGVQAQDISTKNYSVNPQYNYQRETGERLFDGYRVNQTIELIIRDLDQVSAIVTKISDFKVDNVSGLSFYVQDDESIRDDLREQAIKDAKDKARVLAKDLGVNLETIVGFNEGGNNYYPQPLYARSYGVEADFAVAEASIPAGENSYQAHVTIEYLIK